MAADPRTGPPEEFQALYDHVVTCGKCGFCQPTCPVFRATGREGHVARGKIALYRNIIEERMEIGPDAKDAFANCLLCRACTENCFSAVKTDQVVLSFRHAYAQRFGRGFLQRRVFRSLLPRPRLMRGLVRSIWALRKTGLADAARRVGLIGLLNPKLERALELRAGTPGPLLSTRLAKRATSGGEGRPLVGYWMSCGYNYVLPEVGEATVRVLERLGMAVEVLDNCCCGLAAHGYGDREAAAKLARENLRRIGDLNRFEAIVSECGSCSGHLKEYAEVLADDPEWSGSAARLKDKVRSFSEFVVEHGGLAPLLGDRQSGAAGAAPAAAASETGESAAAAVTVVTYHDPCHLGRRYQNVVAQPRQLLRSLPGIDFREATESDACCGAAGTYGVLHPETSASIIERKMGFVRNTGASVIVTECPSCMMQLGFGAQRAGLNVSVQNISQMCDSVAMRNSSA
jgi:glycolate oxidase iron-sulfur subunit